MQILKQLREEGRAQDMQALMEHIPFARFMGVQVDRKGNEVTTILPFQEILFRLAVTQFYTKSSFSNLMKP